MAAKKGGKMVVLCIIMAILAVIIIWFLIPYSPVKKEFEKDIEAVKRENVTGLEGKFTKEDFAMLPLAIQKYIEGCGYIGTPYMDSLCMEYKDVAFMQGKQGPALKIDYTQYDFVKAPCRRHLLTAVCSECRLKAMTTIGTERAA